MKSDSNVLVEIKPKKTRTVSLRISEQSISELEKESKTNLVSTNVLINQILHNYITWDRYRQKMKMYPVSEEILRVIIKNTKESEMSQLVDLVYSSIRESALMMKKKFNLKSCLQVIKEYCNMFGITFDDSISSEKNIFTIRHNMGKNFSLLFEKLFEKIFWDLQKTRIVDCQSTETCIVVTIKTGNN